MTALIGKQVAAAMAFTTVAANYDKTRLLAVAMEKRHSRFPDVPTFRELGIDIVSGAIAASPCRSRRPNRSARSSRR